MVSSIVGYTGRKVHARKCAVGIVDSATATEFMDSNHIQGTAPCSKWIGLYHEGRLVCLMGFGKARFDKSCDWELIRFANILDTTVVGGFSKCLSFFRKTHGGSIVSYADYSRSNGEVYIKTGSRERVLANRLIAGSLETSCSIVIRRCEGTLRSF